MTQPPNFNHVIRICDESVQDTVTDTFYILWLLELLTHQSADFELEAV